MKVDVSYYYEPNKKERLYKKVEKKDKPPYPILEMIFGTLNIVIAVISMLIIAIINYLKPIVNSLLGQNFPFNTRQLLILSILLLIFGVLLELFSLERARSKNHKIIALIIFFYSFFMVFMITYIIVRYSLAWMGIQLFGNTELGANKWFYLPSIGFLFYSFFIVYYSFVLLRR